MPVRVLLDESLPLRLARHLEGVDAETVIDRGWSGLTNGKLLRVADENFDGFLTADQNLPYQQNLEKFSIRVVVLAPRTNRLVDLVPLVPAALAAFRRLDAGEFAVVREDDI